MSVDKNNIYVPDFMNFKFFESALRDGLKEKDIELQSVFFTMGPKRGENFCSQIYRADVHFCAENVQKQSISLVIKILHDTPIGKYFGEVGLFQNECLVYQTALGKIADILGGENIAPKFFYFTSEPAVALVLLDVSPLGYMLADRVNGLDEVHCSLVFQKLAKYHAASMVLVKQDPEIEEKLSVNYLAKQVKGTDEMRGSFRRNFEHLAEVVATWPGFEETARKINKFIEEMNDDFFKRCGPQENEMKVLVHNDVWTNNILFKYDSGKPKDLFFVDFQMSYYSSPGIDLCHFFYTSPQIKLLLEKRDFMIEEYYYKPLATTLANLGFDTIPSLKDIYDEVCRREEVGFFWAVIKMCLLCMPPEECGENSLDNLADIEIGRRIRQIGMSTERYIVIMKYILRRMESLGVLK